jgi:hypothetical protein
MTNELAVYENNDDGFSDAAEEHSENLLRGELLKCSDGHWLVGQESSRLPRDTRLVCVGIAAAWVRWSENRPVEHRIRKPGKRLPEREELGHLDKDDWESTPDGEPRDPWQNTRVAYFINPATAAVYTFSTTTYSGRPAVTGLGDQVMRMRIAKPGVSPVVEFDSAPHKTKYGLKMKPILKVVGWVGGSGEGVDLKQIGKEKPATKGNIVDVTATDDMDDSIPF